MLTSRQRLLLFLSVGLILVLLVSVLVHRNRSLAPARPDDARGSTPRAAESLATRLYLPAVLHVYPSFSGFGIETASLLEDASLSAGLLNASFLRRNGLSWADVAPAEELRYWPAELEAELAYNSGYLHLELILVVRRTPEWAQALPGSFCGPISQEKIPAFAQFMHEVVARYSQAPYNVHYYEIWNEPDVAGHQGDEVYGCWGDPTEAYYGGEYYGEVLKAVYPQVKSASPLAQMLLGGLLLGCDPNTTAACDDPAPLKFLEGVLRSNAGACAGNGCFDGVSFHAYDYYGGGLGRFFNPSWPASWDTTGPVLATKAQFIKNLLNEYRVSGKYLINTESALLKVVPPCDQACQDTKAYYLAQLYAMANAEGLRGNLWYSLAGWRDSGLVDASNQKLPAFHAFIASQSLLEQAVYQDRVAEYPGVTGYRFHRPGGPLWLVWSLDGRDHAITLPKTPSRIWDVFGAEQVIPGATISVTIAPQYIQFDSGD
jgi:hypothetical protein